MKLREKVSRQANLENLSPIDKKYYQYVISMNELQEQLNEAYKKIYYFQSQLEAAASAKYRKNTSVLENERQGKNLEILKVYQDDLKKNRLKFFIFKGKKNKRTQQYQEEINKNNIFYEFQKNMLKEEMQDLLDDEKRHNDSVNEQINLLHINISEIRSKMSLLRNAYYGEKIFDKQFIKK